MALTSIVVVSMLLFRIVVSETVVVHLNGDWTVQNSAKGYNLTGEVPGSMYTALYNNSLIPDPLYRDNDVKLRWVGDDDWTYTRKFQCERLQFNEFRVTSEQLSRGSILLVCDGLDTFSTVYINDNIVGSSENMFVQYVYDIKNATKVGDNMIRVEFLSAVKMAAQKASSSAYDIPHDCPLSCQHGECHVNMIRKEQCSFSWNWGPSFPTQGIWKDIYIKAFNTADIRELSVSAYQVSTGEWEVDVSVHFDVSEGQVSGSFSTQIIGTPVSKSQPVILSPSNNSVIYTVTIPKNVPIQRWWPNGYGNQTMYLVNVTFISARGKEVTTKSRKVGFRTVQLVQDAIGKDQGLSFYFKINETPVFFKGTNWIPVDSFQETITRERLRRLLQSAAEVHINSMRVWGGGVYESDDLYDLADELGIMIWQDLMFSVALYPTTSEFLHTVSQEIKHQIRRLRHHPCIVIWAGNNENEAGLRGGWFGNLKHFTRYYDDYVKLYVNTIMPLVAEEDPTRAYLTSSPSNGQETRREGWLAKDPSSQHYGDVHFYDFTADLWNVSSFPIPRFASEYGTAAWCDPESLDDVFDQSDFDYWGKMASHRNHEPLGNIQMMERLVLHFNEPTSQNTTQRFLDLIYLIQINQAVSMQAESEHYRRWQNDLTEDGRGQTMGALYWQLNDIWQAPTWASIDYKGKWKMLHYFVRKFFAPILVSPYLNGTDLVVSMVVDELPMVEVKDTKNGVNQFSPVDNYKDLLKTSFPPEDLLHLQTKICMVVSGTLFVEMYRWNNFTPLKTWNTTYRLTRSSELVFRQDVTSLLRDSNCPGTSHCFLYFYVNDRNSGISASLPLTYYKSVTGLTKAEIKFTDVSRISDTEILVKLESNRVAPFVWVDAKGFSGRFSDNGFLMFTPLKVVIFTAWDHVTDLDLFRKSLSVRSLMDVEVQT